VITPLSTRARRRRLSRRREGKRYVREPPIGRERGTLEYGSSGQIIGDFTKKPAPKYLITDISVGCYYLDQLYCTREGTLYCNLEEYSKRSLQNIRSFNTILEGVSHSGGI